MTTASHLQKWYEEVWNNANEKHITEMMHPDVIIHGLDSSGTTKGIKSFLEFYENFRKSFPSVKVELNPLVHDHDTAAAYCNVTARSTTQREVSFSGLCVVRYKDGKMIEGWNNFDFLKMYQQMRKKPENSVDFI